MQYGGYQFGASPLRELLATFPIQWDKGDARDQHEGRAPEACEGEDGQLGTTVMLRNIACRFMEDEVRSTLDELGLEGKYDEIYVPKGMNGKSNMGYVFVNFLEAAYVDECRELCDGKVFGRSGTTKLCKVVPAHRQGSRDGGANETPKEVPCEVDAPQRTVAPPPGLFGPPGLEARASVAGCIKKGSYPTPSCLSEYDPREAQLHDVGGVLGCTKKGSYPTPSHLADFDPSEMPLAPMSSGDSASTSISKADSHFSWGGETAASFSQIPAYQYRQADASMYGDDFEFEGSEQVYREWDNNTKREMGHSSGVGPQMGDETTVMLRNIACRYTHDDIVDILDDMGLVGKYDLVYAPQRTSTQSNLGYVFVNFLHSMYAEECRRLCDGRLFGGAATEKHCQVVLAHLQGRSMAVGSRRKGCKVYNAAILPPPHQINELLAEGSAVRFSV